MRTPDELNALVTRLSAAERFAFDTETTSLNYIDAELVGLSFAVAPNEAAYVPVAHDYDNAPKQLSRDEVLKQLQPLLETKKVILQNAKYDMAILPLVSL